jgi:hypothetical protein
MVSAVVVLVVALGWKQSKPAMSAIGPYHTYGLTGWLIAYQFGNVRADGSWTQQRFQIDPVGLIGALAITAAAIATCLWSYRRLVGVLTLTGRCDWCAYDLTALESERCPECGRRVIGTEGLRH